MSTDEPPQGGLPGAPKPGAEPFRELGGKVKTVYVLTILMSVALAFTAVGNVFFHAELGELIADEGNLSPLSADSAADLDDRFAVGLASFYLPFLTFIGLWIATFVVTIVWFRATYRNMRALGRTTEQRAGWAVWAWIVPLVNLVMPRIMAGEVVRAAAERLGQIRTSVALLNWWWAAWIVTSILPTFLGTDESASYQEVRDDLALTRFFIVVAAIQIWVTYLVVKRLSADINDWRTKETGVGSDAGADAESQLIGSTEFPGS